MEKEQFLYKKNLSGFKKNKILAGELEEGTCLPQTGELAAEYGVSTITITNALNALKGEGYLNRIKGKGSFIQLPVKSAGTLTNCLDAASERYENPDRDKMLGLVLEHVSSCFGLDMMYAMDAMAAEAGYKLCVRFSYGEREKETEEIEFLKELGVSGIIVMPCHGIYYNTAILKLVVEEFPMILIDKKNGGDSGSIRKNRQLYCHERAGGLSGS